VIGVVTMIATQAWPTLAARGFNLRLAAVAVLAGVGLTACASVSPEMAARPAPTPAPHAYAQKSAPPADRAAVDGPGERALEGGRYKLGAPYEVAGTWYVPAEEPHYDEVGVASWYGDDFAGKATANGERFDMYSASAAHATLPLPSILEVTNLENGRTIRVRLNDRGPFKAGRIIDLSRGAAEALGYMEKGTAKVRVRYIGPARLGGGLEPLYVANAGPAGPVPEARVPAMPVPAVPAYASAPAPVPAWSAAAASSDGYAVQAGAFSDRAKAERIADSLSRAGAAAVRPIDMADRRLYRVVLGPWNDAGQADAAREQVASMGFSDARVIRAF